VRTVLAAHLDPLLDAADALGVGVLYAAGGDDALQVGDDRTGLVEGFTRGTGRLGVGEQGKREEQQGGGQARHHLVPLRRSSGRTVPACRPAAPASMVTPRVTATTPCGACLRPPP